MLLYDFFSSPFPFPFTRCTFVIGVVGTRLVIFFLTVHRVSFFARNRAMNGGGLLACLLALLVNL